MITSGVGRGGLGGPGEEDKEEGRLLFVEFDNLLTPTTAMTARREMPVMMPAIISASFMGELEPEGLEDDMGGGG